MTRLQKLLLQIKSVKELSEILNIAESEIVSEIAETKNGSPLHCNNRNCSRCAFYDNVNGCNMNSSAMREYLDGDIPQFVYADTESVKTNCSTEIIAMRDEARKALLAFLKKKLIAGADANETGIIISHNITLLEKIGLFEPNELRNEFIHFLEILS